MNKKNIGKKINSTILLSLLFVQVLLVATPAIAQNQPRAISDLVAVPLQGTNPQNQNTRNQNNTPQKPILNTIAGDKKQCPYIGEGLYKPFSNISTDFAIFKAFNMDSTAKEGCIKVQGGMDQFLLLIFKIFIGFCSVLAVIFIAVSGITMITEESNIQKKIKAKDMLWRALQGLLLSLVAWILLFTINERLVKFSVDDVFRATNFQQTIAQGYTNTPNFNVIAAGGTAANYLQTPVAPAVGTGGTGMYPGYGVLAPSAGPNPYVGTQDSNGAIFTPQATIFGYRDGDGRTGSTGDNGIGGSALTHVRGRTNYTGDTRSVGVAVPTTWILRDFGGYDAAVNSAYAIYENGVHKGNFPIVDVSQSKLDFTYGMVIANFNPNPPRNRSNTDWAWSSYGISYKPLPGFWLSNPRPANPMIEYKRVLGTAKSGYGMHLISEVLPQDVVNAIQNNTVNVIMQ